MESERRVGARAALLGILGAQGLLVGLTLKMRIGSVYSAPASRAGAMSGGAAAAASTRATYASGSHMRPQITSHPLVASVLSGAHAEMDSVGNAARARLAAQGLAWAPMLANVTVAATYSIFVYLNSALEGMPPCIVPVSLACSVLPPCQNALTRFLM
jgi:hypothetical protein